MNIFGWLFGATDVERTKDQDEDWADGYDAGMERAYLEVRAVMKAHGVDVNRAEREQDELNERRTREEGTE